MLSIGEKVDAPKGAFFMVRRMEKRWSERKSEVEEIFFIFFCFFVLLQGKVVVNLVKYSNRCARL